MLAVSCSAVQKDWKLQADTIHSPTKGVLGFVSESLSCSASHPRQASSVPSFAGPWEFSWSPRIVGVGFDGWMIWSVIVKARSVVFLRVKRLHTIHMNVIFFLKKAAEIKGPRGRPKNPGLRAFKEVYSSAAHIGRLSKYINHRHSLRWWCPDGLENLWRRPSGMMT